MIGTKYNMNVESNRNFKLSISVSAGVMRWSVAGFKSNEEKKMQSESEMIINDEHNNELTIGSWKWI